MINQHYFAKDLPVSQKSIVEYLHFFDCRLGIISLMLAIQLHTTSFNRPGRGLSDDLSLSYTMKAMNLPNKGVCMTIRHAQQQVIVIIVIKSTESGTELPIPLNHPVFDSWVRS